MMYKLHICINLLQAVEITVKWWHTLDVTGSKCSPSRSSLCHSATANAAATAAMRCWCRNIEEASWRCHRCSSCLSGNTLLPIASVLSVWQVSSFSQPVCLNGVQNSGGVNQTLVFIHSNSRNMAEILWILCVTHYHHHHHWAVCKTACRRLSSVILQFDLSFLPVSWVMVYDCSQNQISNNSAVGWLRQFEQTDVMLYWNIITIVKCTVCFWCSLVETWHNKPSEVLCSDMWSWRARGTSVAWISRKCTWQDSCDTGAVAGCFEIRRKGDF